MHANINGKNGLYEVNAKIITIPAQNAAKAPEVIILTESLVFDKMF